VSVTHDAGADLHTMTLANDKAYIHPRTEKGYKWLFLRFAPQIQKQYEKSGHQPCVTHQFLALLIAQAIEAGISVQHEYAPDKKQSNGRT